MAPMSYPRWWNHHYWRSVSWSSIQFPASTTDKGQIVHIIYSFYSFLFRVPLKLRHRSRVNAGFVSIYAPGDLFSAVRKIFHRTQFCGQPQGLPRGFNTDYAVDLLLLLCGSDLLFDNNVHHRYTMGILLGRSSSRIFWLDLWLDFKQIGQTIIISRR